MEIYLIRHTTPDIAKGICYGQSDIPLSNTFSSEAKQCIAALPKYFDKVYSSPLNRCLQLANCISDEVRIDARLRELNFGDWELKKWSEIPLQEIQPWYDDWVSTAPKNGESYQELQHRACAFLEEIPTSYARIAIVTHSGVIRALWAFFNQVALKDSFNELTITYGDVIKLTT